MKTNLYEFCVDVFMLWIWILWWFNKDCEVSITLFILWKLIFNLQSVFDMIAFLSNFINLFLTFHRWWKINEIKFKSIFFSSHELFCTFNSHFIGHTLIFLFVQSEMDSLRSPSAHQKLFGDEGTRDTHLVWHNLKTHQIYSNKWIHLMFGLFL